MHLRPGLLAAVLATTAAATLSVATAPADAALIPNRCTYTNREPTLRSGSSGIAVRQAQCEYNIATRGADLVVDGSYGPRTRSAIVRFQRCVGIADDGVVGPVTWRNLNYWAASDQYPVRC